MKKDYTGQKFGRLTVIERLEKYRNGYTYYKCKCDCGKETILYSSAFISGKTSSCGCYNRDVARKRLTTHGLRKTQIYKTWAGIKDRTNLNNHNCKDNYRKLEITMCEEWRDDFMAFYNWAIKNGYKEEKSPNGRNKWTIDRIDNYKGYEPSNCRWVTSKEQSNNQTRNRQITYKGKTQTLAQWCEELKLNYGLVEQRLYKGWDIERAFTESSDKKRYFEYKGELLTKYDIAKRTGISVNNIENRLHRKWSIERIMTQPENKNKKVVKENV